MRYTECANGHVYDADQYAVCPYCNQAQTEIQFGPGGGRTVAPGGAGGTVAPGGFGPAPGGATVAPGGFGGSPLDGERIMPWAAERTHKRRWPRICSGGRRSNPTRP